MFHPDLLRGTSLSKRIVEYSFFSYSSNEALHMSEREQQIIINCFHEIQEELQQNIDKHTKQLVAANIKVLLNNRLYSEPIQSFQLRTYKNRRGDIRLNIASPV